jgi:hypothetical protein
MKMAKKEDGVIAEMPKRLDDDEESSSSSEESEDEDLVLEGVATRNTNVTSSSEEDDEDDDEGNDAKDDAKLSVNPSASRNNRKLLLDPASKTTKKRKKSDDEILQVEFTFCDMNDKFFHGLKALLHDSSTVYQGQHSSELSNLMIENVSVGTVVSTEGDQEGTVYGFASVLNVKTYQQSPVIQYLSELCLKHCPAIHRKELEIVLSGKTKRPAGFLLHGRMINMPMEIVEVLQQQLVKDMDWAVKSAEGGVEEQKSLDFGAFVRLAPCQQEGGSIFYRFFDDEIFADKAEFVYTFDAPKSYSKEEKQGINVMVLTKTGHRTALKDLARMIHGITDSP